MILFMLLLFFLNFFWKRLFFKHFLICLAEYGSFVSWLLPVDIGRHQRLVARKQIFRAQKTPETMVKTGIDPKQRLLTIGIGIYSCFHYDHHLTEILKEHP